MGLYHNTIKVSKVIRFGGNRLNRYKPTIIREKINEHKVHEIEGKDKAWFLNKLQHATFDIMDSDDQKSIIDADKVLSGTLEVLGAQVSLQEPIQWNKDFKSGFVWKNGINYTRYTIINDKDNSDVKNVWELSRCHFLLWLAGAYRSTKEEKYAKKVIEIILDWIDNNPFERNINWTCSMEVAIRAVNWIFALSMISESKNVTEQSLRPIFRSLYMHGSHIFTNLEDDFPYSANHFLSNLVGLIFLGYLFDDNDYGKKWLGFALRAFLYEIRSQILPSGAHYEKSISYHRLITEIILYGYIIIKKNSPEFISLDITSRTKSLITFIVSYTKPNGKAPLIADNDNGRFLPFVRRDYREHIYLVDLFKEYGLINRTPSKNMLFFDAGMCFINNKTYYVNFINSGVSKYIRQDRKRLIGTHTHLDALSFEVTKSNKDFLVDPGSYIYTMDRKLRDEFRSSLKHNTLSVDNLSPYALSNYFNISTDSTGGFYEPCEIELEGQEDRYVVSSKCIWHKKGVTHKRVISVLDDHILIEDLIESDQEHLYTLSFHLDPEVEIMSFDMNCITLRNGNAYMSFHIYSNVNTEIKISDDTFSPSYGVLLSSKTIRLQTRAVGNCEVKIQLK